MKNENSRAERFCNTESVRLATDHPVNNSFEGPQKWGSKFIIEWMDRNGAATATPPRWSEIIEQAVTGIYFI